MNKFILVAIFFLIGWFLVPDLYSGKVLAQVTSDDSESYSYSESESSSEESTSEDGGNTDENEDGSECTDEYDCLGNYEADSGDTDCTVPCDSECESEQVDSNSDDGSC